MGAVRTLISGRSWSRRPSPKLTGFRFFEATIAEKTPAAAMAALLRSNEVCTGCRVLSPRLTSLPWPRLLQRDRMIRRRSGLTGCFCVHIGHGRAEPPSESPLGCNPREADSRGQPVAPHNNASTLETYGGRALSRNSQNFPTGDKRSPLGPTIAFYLRIDRRISTLLHPLTHAMSREHPCTHAL